MPHTLDQILPSLEALGLWSYWIIGATALIEAFFVTGLFVPGMLVVVAGGILVQQGVLGYLDLAWFVAIGSFLGSEASYWAGILARKGIERRWNTQGSPQYNRARRLFERRGGLALVIGRFLGPLSGFVALAAVISGIERRKFLLWNGVSALAYALLLPLAGFALGNVMTRIGPLSTRLIMFAGAVLIALVLLWWIVVRVSRMLPFVLSILRSIVSAVTQNGEVQAWASRHPRAARFIANRFDRAHFSGLTTTFLAVAIGYVLISWVDSATSFLSGDAIIELDTRLANLIHAFWVPGLLRLFTYVTALGDVRVVTALLVGALVWLWFRSRPDLMLGLTVSVLGDVTTVALLKRMFDRPRPELAYFVETSGSFPSGHAAMSAAFFGMLFYVLWRIKVLGPVKAALAAVTIGFAIGLSRLYLIEHYLSDIVNGWLVGTLWALVGVSLAEWWNAIRPGIEEQPPKPGVMPLIVGAVCLGLAGWQIATYEKPYNAAPLPVGDRVVTDVDHLFTGLVLPYETESVFGNALEPVNIVLLAANLDTVKTSMTEAGWTEAQAPTLRTLAFAGMAALTNSGDNDAPVTPYFWRSLPNDTAFLKQTAENSVRKRHHVRFWRTSFVTPEGLRLFVAAASFDDGLDWQMLHHIDPDIDAERDKIVGELREQGVVAKVEMARFASPRLGQSVAGDPWFTDGRVAVVTLQ